MNPTESVESLLTGYERGALNRRQLVLSLTALAAAPLAARAQGDVLRARSLNHVSLIVSDLERSVTFYQRLFGMPVKSVQDGGVNLAVGDAFLGIYQGSASAMPQINHFCFGLQDFDPERTVAALAESGVPGQSRVRDGVPQVYCADPDGLRVQLQDLSFCGGLGPLGNECL
jgi:catechol 2,3-dioxygenase-like lactoylglutathione lyase family enzyme